MSRRRALLTDRERELIADEDAESQRYVAVSRVRTKIEDELPEDVRIIAQHHPDLLEELREVVCQDVEAAGEAAREGERSPPGEPRTEPAEPPHDTEDDPLAALSFPSGVGHEEGAAAILAARDHLQEHGSATMRQLVLEVMPEHPLKYDPPESLETSERYRGAWWRNVVKPGLEALDDVEKPGRGGSEWKYVGGTDE